MMSPYLCNDSHANDDFAFAGFVTDSPTAIVSIGALECCISEKTTQVNYKSNHYHAGI